MFVKMTSPRSVLVASVKPSLPSAPQWLLSTTTVRISASPTKPAAQIIVATKKKRRPQIAASHHNRVEYIDTMVPRKPQTPSKSQVLMETKKGRGSRVCRARVHVPRGNIQCHRPVAAARRSIRRQRSKGAAGALIVKEEPHEGCNREDRPLQAFFKGKSSFAPCKCTTRSQSPCMEDHLDATHDSSPCEEPLSNTRWRA